MENLPDAPWIRDAEINGVPDAPAPICPVCGDEAEEFYLDRDGDVIGCDRCIRLIEAYYYEQAHNEEE